MSYDENIYAKIVSGTLTQEDEKRLKDSGEWDEIQSILEATKDLSLPKHNKEAGYQKLKSLKAKKSGKTKVKRLYSISMGVAAILVLTLGYMFLMQGTGYNQSAVYGQTLAFDLKDNTKVILNDGSSLDYKNFMENGIRSVRLDGEGYFEVIPGNRFLVQTQNGNVEVLGTAFNIRSWGTSFEVECYSGKVAVISNDEKKEITAGQSIRLTEGRFASIENTSYDKPVWMDGVSKFSNVIIGEVFNEVERQYNVDIKIPPLQKPFTGVFEHDDLRKSLEKICIPMGLSFDIIDEKSIIISE